MYIPLKKYKRIVDELVKKSFPKLKEKKIFLTLSKIQLKSAIASVIYFGFGFWIVLFPLSKKYSDNMLKAILAHELSHSEMIFEMSFFKKMKFALKWLFSKKEKSRFETLADKRVIDKGYAKSLFYTVKLIEKIRTKKQLEQRTKDGYLSSKQIKSYAKKIGKWQ